MGGLAYCIKCKGKVETKDSTLIYFKNGVPAEKGLCIKCGSKVLRILTKGEREAMKEKAQPTI